MPESVFTMGRNTHRGTWSTARASDNEHVAGGAAVADEALPTGAQRRQSPPLDPVSHVDVQCPVIALAMGRAGRTLNVCSHAVLR